jgi:hypothetical protein
MLSVILGLSAGSLFSSAWPRSPTRHPIPQGAIPKALRHEPHEFISSAASVLARQLWSVTSVAVFPRKARSERHRNSPTRFVSSELDGYG